MSPIIQLMDILVGDNFLFVIALQYSALSCLSESVSMRLFYSSATHDRLVVTRQVWGTEGEKGLDTLSRDGAAWQSMCTWGHLWLLVTSQGEVGESPTEAGFHSLVCEEEHWVNMGGDLWGFVSLKCLPHITSPWWHPTEHSCWNRSHYHTRLINSAPWPSVFKGCICLNTQEGGSEHNTLKYLFAIN